MPLAPQPPECEGCPAWDVGRSYVPGAGPADARIALIGQGPGEDEAWAQVPFVGRSGRMLDEWLAKAGIYRHKVWIDNAVRCWLPKNRAPHQAELATCYERHWGLPALEQLPNLKVVVGVGVPAMQAILSPRASANWAGMAKEIELGDKLVYGVGILHPAGIMRGAWAEEPFQIITLERARRVAERGSWTIDDPTLPPPGALLDPTLDQVRSWFAAAGPDGVTVDIETAGRHIVCVGLCRVRDLVPIVIHFLGVDGKLYWPEESWAEVRSLLGACLADPTIPLIFHNGQAFDVPILEGQGFKVGGYLWDTLLMQHIAYPEMAKGLEHCARLYCGVNGWKHILGSTDETGEWK